MVHTIPATTAYERIMTIYECPLRSSTRLGKAHILNSDGDCRWCGREGVAVSSEEPTTEYVGFDPAINETSAGMGWNDQR